MFQGKARKVLCRRAVAGGTNRRFTQVRVRRVSACRYGMILLRLEYTLVREFSGAFMSKVNLKKWIPTALFLLSMFFVGRAVGYAVNHAAITSGRVLEQENWGLGFGKDGTQPSGNASAAELKKYDAYYVGDGKEKVIYLTFDCGYENGNTEPILDALKKHNAKATFFVVGHFLESAPEIAKRMVEDGHTVGNHTYHHPDMSSISSLEAFQKEMDDVAALFEQVTGSKLAMYYRPPQGKYSTKNLEMAKQLGYHTFFWSLAYVDWYQDKQPSKEEAFNKLQIGRAHV